jgi:hypothetical protein
MCQVGQGRAGSLSITRPLPGATIMYPGRPGDSSFSAATNVVREQQNELSLLPFELATAKFGGARWRPNG